MLLLVLLVAWAVGSYLSVESGVSAANDRVPAGVERQLKKRDGLLVSTPTTILVLGTDGGNRAGTGGREPVGLDHACCAPIPESGASPTSRSRATSRSRSPSSGSRRSMRRTSSVGRRSPCARSRTSPGLDVNHVVFVDFDRFEELIDAVGGIDINVPRPIRSNRFDCPYKTAARCAQWKGWRFERGVQHMDGRRALVYSRIRHNLLNPAETDFDRARRQQEVVGATLDKVTSVGTALRLPFVGGDLVRPLATDLSAWDLMQLGWVYFRADTGRALHCRLGGDPATVGGESVILGTEDNVSTVAMFTDRSAPLPPPRGQPYAPGCLVGD